MKRRLAILTTHPIQYQIPWFRHLAAQDGWETHVLFGMKSGAEDYVDREFGKKIAWDLSMLEGYSYEFLKNVSRCQSLDRYAGIDTPSVEQRLADGRFDAVLALGWQTKSYWQGFAAAHRLGLPLLLRGESNLLAPRPLWKRWARQVCLRRLFARTHGCLAIGTWNRIFYEAHGVPPSKIRNAPYFVDNERFRAGADRREAIREEIGADAEDFIFLFSGKLVARKRPQDLLEAWKLLPDASRKRSHVIFVGEGEQRAKLRDRASADRSRVHFPGFINQTELPGWYAAADALVLPSDYGETWGLCVNEAMASGTRAVVSDRVGCAPDLIRPGVTGEIFPCGDLLFLRGCLQRYVQDADWVRHPNQRAAVQQHIEKFSMANATIALREGLDSLGKNA